jgi:5'-methylthioadenosine phosphorylase
MVEAIYTGVIGGSGLYDMPGITDKRRISVQTPFGDPSSEIVVGNLNGKTVAFLARHGNGHIHPPASVPHRANIYALKSLGVRFIIAVNACGSLRTEFAPGHIMIPDQLFDYCIGIRDRSFFQGNIVAHVSVGDPFDEYLRSILIQAGSVTEKVIHPRGTFIVEDGPRFATRAESRIFQQWGCDIIGMTSVPEAFLAREAEIAYASLAHITDYDSWRVEETAVNVQMVIETAHRNISAAQTMVAKAVELLDEHRQTPSHTALTHAIMTARQHMPQGEIDTLYPIIRRALNL